MDHSREFNSNLTLFKQSSIGSWLTIFGSLVLMLFSASVLVGCSPGATTNNSGVGKSGISGGGATKDPGDGTGGATGDGGGGQGILCGESKDPTLKNRLFVRDLYEAQNDRKLHMKTIPNDSVGADLVSTEAFKVLVSSIRSYFGPASPNLEFANEEFWRTFSKRISFIAGDRELHGSQDANSPIALPAECRVVQIAYWSDSSDAVNEGILYINSKYWRQLDQLNKVALMAHEFFFKQARKAQDQNSDTVRFNIGQMFALNGFSPLFKQWTPSREERAKSILPASINGFKVCNGFSREEPTAKIQFYQYEGKDGRQHFTIPLLTSNSVNLSFLSGSQFSFDPNENADLAAGTDLLFYPQYLYPLYYDSDGEYRKSEFSDWFERWYSNIGLINNRNMGSDLFSFTTRVSMAIKKRDIFWRDNTGTKNNSVTIELLNHVLAIKDVEKIPQKSREELVKEIHKQMRSELDRCYFFRQEGLTEAILVADNEVREFIDAGAFPGTFPKWASAIQKFKIRPWDEKRGGPNPCPLSEHRIMQELPNALLNVSANNYDEALLIHLLGKDFFVKDIVGKPVPGIIRVSQSNRALDFRLTCEDYRDIYFNNFGIRVPLRADLVTQDKNVVMLPMRDLKTTVSVDSKVAQANIAYEKFGSFLSFRQDASRNFQNLISSFQKVCGSGDNAWNILGYSCKHQKSFLSELSSEKNIVLKLCSEVPGLMESKNQANCVVAEMKKTQNSYMIYFSTSENAVNENQEKIEIELVRMIHN